MIEIVNGNLFDSKETLIVHQVNCVGRMGSGVAKQVSDTYPHVVKEYRKYLKHCNKKGIDPLGTIQCVPVHVWALPMINTMDRIWFSEEQLEQGYRLGCQVYADDEALEVELI